MAVLRKFKAWRPKKGFEKKVASFPYDVLNSEEAKEIAKDNPFSFLHVVKPEIDLPEGINLYDETVYRKAKDNLNKLMDEGILIHEKNPELYIYRQTMDGREQYGIVGCVSVEDYDNDIIKKHEHTRKVKEKDRINHVDVTNVNAGPIFMTYKASTVIDKIVLTSIKNKPLYDFEADDGIGHTVWITTQEESDILIREFKGIDYFYVADGHHRSASAAHVANMRKTSNPNPTGQEEYNFFLAVLFPDNQLKIMDYNRVVKHLNSHSESDLFSTLDKLFYVKKWGKDSYKPCEKREIGMYYEKVWYKLIIKKELVDCKDPVNSLDTAFLQNNLLSPFFGIADIRTSDDIGFIGGIRGLGELKKLVDSGTYKIAFAMYPTSIHELMNIADSGLVMSPKSTWFEPKLRSGLLIHSLAD